jgi:hypothetical protein
MLPWFWTVARGVARDLGGGVGQAMAELRELNRHELLEGVRVEPS